MAGILTIAPGSPHWWLSPDIWVTPVGSPTTPPGTANPIAGQAYNVSVRLHDNYPEPVPSGWNLFVCWVIPTTGPFPLPTGGQVLNNAPITVNVPATSAVIVQTAMTWTPSFENGGHECLVAAAYGTARGEGLPPSLDADPSDNDTNQGYLSTAQHNLGVVSLVPPPKGPRIHYAFQVCNGFDEERTSLDVQGAAGAAVADRGISSARRAGRPHPASSGRSKVERLGLLASRQARFQGVGDPAPAVLHKAARRDRAAQLPAVPQLGGSLEERQRADQRHSEPGRARGRRAQRAGDGRGEVTARAARAAASLLKIIAELKRRGSPTGWRSGVARPAPFYRGGTDGPPGRQRQPCCQPCYRRASPSH